MAKLLAKIPALTQNLIKESQPKLRVAWKYARVELAPPTPGDIPKAIGGLRNIVKSAATGRYKQITVREAWLNTLVAAEVGFWFFVGECIGRRHLIGYDV